MAQTIWIWAWVQTEQTWKTVSFELQKWLEELLHEVGTLTDGWNILNYKEGFFIAVLKSGASAEVFLVSGQDESAVQAQYTETNKPPVKRGRTLTDDEWAVIKLVYGEQLPPQYPGQQLIPWIWTLQKWEQLGGVLRNELHTMYSSRIPFTDEITYIGGESEFRIFVFKKDRKIKIFLADFDHNVADEIRFVYYSLEERFPIGRGVRIDSLSTINRMKALYQDYHDKYHGGAVHPPSRSAVYVQSTLADKWDEARQEDIALYEIAVQNAHLPVVNMTTPWTVQASSRSAQTLIVEGPTGGLFHKITLETHLMQQISLSNDTKHPGARLFGDVLERPDQLLHVLERAVISNFQALPVFVQADVANEWIALSESDILTGFYRETIAEDEATQWTLHKVFEMESWKLALVRAPGYDVYQIALSNLRIRRVSTDPKSKHRGAILHPVPPSYLVDLINNARAQLNIDEKVQPPQLAYPGRLSSKISTTE